MTTNILKKKRNQKNSSSYWREVMIFRAKLLPINFCTFLLSSYWQESMAKLRHPINSIIQYENQTSLDHSNGQNTNKSRVPIKQIE